MTETRKCTSCGTGLAAESASNLCPRCASSGGVETSDAANPLDRTKTIPLAWPLSEQPGDRIGRYKLLQKIGEGGFGVVYVAEQEVPVRRRVALKVIKLGMDTRAVIARFEAERQALALMDHPNIAKVLDAGATESGRPYFVMEWVKGDRITDYCDKNTLTTRQRLDIFIQICHAIQHAHQKGIIHRDIKPSNILVAVQDGKSVPKVIDFGIAKATERRLTEKTIFTAMGEFIGTPAYMSPEQADMSGLDIDTRSDIYSLGVLLYELLTGKTPFDPKELLAGGVDEMRRAIREEEPRTPSRRLTTMGEGELTTAARHRQTESPKLVHLVRGDLDWIVMKCLEKARTRRYETASGLASDIMRHIDNEPVVARPPSNIYRFQKMVRRNKAAFAAAAVVMAVLLTATGFSVWQAVLAKHRLAESEAISKFLIEVFQSPDPARDGHTITAAEILNLAAKKLDTDLSDHPARRLEIQFTLADTYEALGLYRESIPLREKVRDFCQDVAGPEDPGTIQSMNNLANSYYMAGRLEEALALREKVLALSRKVNGAKDPVTLAAMSNLALSYDEAGRWAEALNLREQSLALFRKVKGPEDLDTIDAMNNLAGSYDNNGRKEEAFKLKQEVLALRLKLSGQTNPRTLMAMVNLANSYDRIGRRDEAVKLHEEALAACRKVLSPEHPDTQRAMQGLADSYDNVGRRDESIKLSEEVLALRRKTLGSEHPDTLLTMYNLACTYEEAGRRDESLKLSEELVPLRRKSLGPEHPDTLKSIHSLANSYDEAGRHEEAFKLREEELSIRRKVPGRENADTLVAMQGLAHCYDGLSRVDQALQVREEALALSRKINGPEHADTLEFMTELGNSYESCGRRSESLKLREETWPLCRKVLGSEHPDTLWALHNLAESYDEAGRYKEGVSLRQELVLLRRKALGPHHPDTLETLDALAWTLATCKVAEIRDGTNALQLAQEIVTTTSRTNANYLDTLAAAYAETGKFDKAAAVQQEALGLMQTEQEKKDYASRLKLYQAKSPYREQEQP